VGLDDRARPGRRLLRHQGVEAVRGRRALRQVLEEARAVGALERRLARGGAVQQLAPRPPVPVLAVEDRPGAQRVGRVPPQRRGEGRELEAAGFGLGEDALAGEEAEHAVQRRGVRAGRARQLLDAPRAVRQQVGEPELRGDVQRQGQAVADDQAAQGRRG
jgi:hypothetical protein